MNNQYLLAECALSVLILFVVLYLTSKAKKDRFRSRIRRRRDNLFDFMWKNEYSYSDPAYTELRNTLNGMIRLSNVVGPVGFFIHLVVSHPERDKIDADDWLVGVADENLKTKLQSVQNKACKDWLRFLYAEGVVGILFRAIWYLLQLSGLAQKINSWFLDKMRFCLKEFNLFGQTDLPESKRTILGKSHPV